jgi:hypothetical protein
MTTKLSLVSRHLDGDSNTRHECYTALLNTRTRHYILKEKITLEVRCKWENNIEAYDREIDCEFMIWI